MPRKRSAERTPLSRKKAELVESMYEQVRARCTSDGTPLVREWGEQAFVTELIRYVVGTSYDRSVIDFDDEDLYQVGIDNRRQRLAYIVVETMDEATLSRLDVIERVGNVLDLVLDANRW